MSDDLLRYIKDLDSRCVDVPDKPKYVGFWRQRPDRGAGNPWPGDMVDPSWDATVRDAVVAHLQAGKVCAMWLGVAFCRLCGARLGTCDLTDGVYVWPQKLDHYLTSHQVKLPDDFIAHVLNWKEESDETQGDRNDS
jgi:hypothetical protein